MQGARARRDKPAGAQAGSPLTFIGGPKEAFALVADEMASAEQALGRLILSDVKAVPDVAGHLAHAGGKRLRPALSALGSKAIGFESDRLGELMCVGELIHLGSLLHDDVVDQGTTRRGQSTANLVFGNAVSVLTGDFCLARAVWLAAEAGGQRTVETLGHAVTLMAEGEVLQLQRAGDLSCTRDAYIEVVERKSAALIAWCAAMGAYVQGNETAITALETFGHKVGIAFQITDDVLDYATGTGKSPGADLRERKVTLPLLYAMERLPGLRAELEAAEPDAQQVASLMQRVEECGALQASLNEARSLADEAIAALQPLPDSDARRALAVLGRFLVERAT